jgi:hypothetical protein
VIPLLAPIISVYLEEKIVFMLVNENEKKEAAVNDLKIGFPRYKPLSGTGGLIQGKIITGGITGFTGKIISPGILNDIINEEDIVDLFYPELPIVICASAEKGSLAGIKGKDSLPQFKNLKVPVSHMSSLDR